MGPWDMAWAVARIVAAAAESRVNRASLKGAFLCFLIYGVSRDDVGVGAGRAGRQGRRVAVVERG